MDNCVMRRSKIRRYLTALIGLTFSFWLLHSFAPATGPMGDENLINSSSKETHKTQDRWKLDDTFWTHDIPDITSSYSLPCSLADDFTNLLHSNGSADTTELQCTHTRLPVLDPRTEKLASEIHARIPGITCLTSKKISKDTPTFAKDTFIEELTSVYDTVALYYNDPDRGSVQWTTRSITLATQCDETRLDLIYEVARRWIGPMVVVVYVSRENFKNFLGDVVAWLRGFLSRADVAVILVQRVGPLYPVNRLRNIAIYYTSTKYLLVHDMDFMMNYDAYSRLQTYVTSKPFNEGAFTALALPAFETKNGITLPTTKSQLLSLLKQNHTRQFHVGVNKCGHIAINYKSWTTATTPYQIPRNPKCFSCFEPYLLVKRDESPVFPELFAQRGKNKIPYYSELCQHNVRIQVVPDVFLLHVNNNRTSYKYYNSTLFAPFDRHLGGCIDASWEAYVVQQKKANTLSSFV